MTAIKPGVPFVPTRTTTGDVPAQSAQKADAPSFVNQASQTLNSSYIQSLLEYANSGSSGEAPVSAGHLPEPDATHSAAQPGEGLKLADGKKWPKGAVHTAGGWTVVPKGNAEWDIFAPGQKPSEKPMSKIWGDPHVEDQDGHAFDFSKSSDFLLPDGTRIYCKNTAEEGHSLSSQLDITNGADHVTISGVNSGKPTTGDVTSDGLGWRESHVNDHQRETFKLGGSVHAAAWFKQVDGIDKGQVSGADFKDGSYKQTTDDAKFYWVDSKLKPALGSTAWREEMQNHLGDLLGSLKLPQDMISMLSNAVYGGGVDRSATDPLAKPNLDPLNLGSPDPTPDAMNNLLGGVLNAKTGDVLGLADVWKSLQGLGDTANDFGDMMSGVNNQRLRFF